MEICENLLVILTFSLDRLQ